MLVLVGLGNPGPDHAGNRHNVGFMAVDAIVRRHGFGPWRARFEGLVSEGWIGSCKALALKPLTYMNESGRSVGQSIRFYKLETRNLLVFYDELDLPTGKLRVKWAGGTGGHNGIRSIDAHIGKDYWRARIGIGHPGTKNLVRGYVLKDFAKSEQPKIEKTIEAIGDALPIFLEKDESAFMTKVDLLTKPPRPPRPRPETRPAAPEEE